ncbi:MAG: TIGR02588 family protein [Acidimicrobiia bacterium]|nr:TIGR02588 family protein [Acidimicrobiia bacterium]
MSPTRMRLTPELVVFAAAVAVLLALAGAIVVLWVQPQEAPSVTVEVVGDVRLVGSQTYMTGEVRNSGDETAEAVQVIGEMTLDGEVVAAGEQVVDFLSGGETESVVFIFDLTMPEADGRLRVASYKVP